MANVSDWKGFEWQVARALGGKRRLRTMESYGKVATDVFFPKEMRKRYPQLKTVAVECKKVRSLNVAREFTVAKVKYGLTGKRIVFAAKRPRPSNWKRHRNILARKLRIKDKKERRKIKQEFFLTPLVTVELEFFQELWQCWLKQGGKHVKAKS